MPEGFDFSSWSQLRLEVAGRLLTLRVEGVPRTVRVTLPGLVQTMALVADDGGGAFSALRVTYGFEELFEDDFLVARGWSMTPDQGEIFVVDKCLVLSHTPRAATALSRSVPTGDSELIINIQLDKTFTDDGFASITFGTTFSFHEAGDRWVLKTQKGIITLPERYDPKRFHQFRFLAQGGQTTLFLEHILLGTFEATGGLPCTIKLMVEQASATIDMVRFTSL